MAVQGGEDVYATLLLTDTYLPGALVLAQSLRDAGTTKRLAVLYTPETVSKEVIEELKAVYDYGIPVDRIRNAHPQNLLLMDRPDLHSAFTKINLWKLTQFRKVVYLDADVLALRAPDELFDLPHAFSAAPDIGWPDIFNTGVMALTPNMGDYHALMAMADRGVSFDGADQGLLNMYFKNDFNRLPFTYNVTPSAHYQYLPAYRHFQTSINLVHFIGQNKPWFLGRDADMKGTPYSDMVGRWWAVYDKHYRVPSPSETPSPAWQTTHPTHHSQKPQDQSTELLKYFVKGEFNPTEQVSAQHHWSEPQPEKREPTPPPPVPTWNAQWQPPPADSKPEAENFPQEHYEMSQDMRPFVPPERYPSPPRNMWYEVPKEPPAPASEKPRAIFPWELHQPPASRVFWDDGLQQSQEGGPRTGELPGPSGSQPAEPSMTGSTIAEAKSEPETPSATAAGAPDTDMWASFDRANVWDEVPQIQRYARKLEEKTQPRRSFVLLRADTGQLAGEAPYGRRGVRVTDFPSEYERPSLPVTPAPMRSHLKSWGSGGPDDGGELPAAEGVPSQADWDPIAQLQKLAKQQSEVLMKRLREEKENGIVGPVGSTGQPSTNVLSPQPVKGSAAANMVRDMIDRSERDSPVMAQSDAERVVSFKDDIPEPSYLGPGSAWERGEGVPMRLSPMPPTEDEKDVFQT